MTIGRFAPSPSGRMHLGNIFTALLSWLSVRKAGGKWILRIEDLDPGRSRMEYARLIEDDLRWLGLDWDEGGIDGRGAGAPYLQSQRGPIYEEMLARLEATGLTYPCYCTRNEIMATQAPHESDGRIVYSGTCRPRRLGGATEYTNPDIAPRSIRLAVPDQIINFRDRVFGPQSVNLRNHCGDFVLRRGDGAWAYQLAVVADDALMGVTEVVRGSDLLLSSAQQIYLYGQLGFPVPEFMHVPLLCNGHGVRFSKRDAGMGMEELRREFSPSGLIGFLAWLAGILPEPFPMSAEGLVQLYTPEVIPDVLNLKVED